MNCIIKYNTLIDSSMSINISRDKNGLVRDVNPKSLAFLVNFVLNYYENYGISTEQGRSVNLI